MLVSLFKMPASPLIFVNEYSHQFFHIQLIKNIFVDILYLYRWAHH